MNTIEQYELGERLGSGGFATVWLGYDPGFDGHVAIKVLGDNWVGQPDVVRRFLDEARLLWRAEDHRVVNVFSIGELATGQPWFAMEHADRGTLDQRLAQTSLSVNAAIGLIAEMGRCVQAVHELDAVHRDVKPGNFLIRSVARSGAAAIPGLAADERLMISDLGFAKVLANSSGFTVAGGSPMYMPPEQASTSAEVGFSSDVFSLGICAWEVLTGSPPDDRGTYGAATQFDPAALPDLLSLRPEISSDVAQVVLRALEPDPADRWQTAGDFVEALLGAHKQGALADAEATKTANPPSPKKKLALGGAMATTAAAIVALVLNMSSGPDLGNAPNWFQLPQGVADSSLSVTSTGNETSVIGALSTSFETSCQQFVSDALANGYLPVRDDCSNEAALASARHADASTAVIAELSDGRVGWRFSTPENAG